jgi:20S proteasome alpha/beta subunit
VKAMTIAAGINCTDGILISADTEHTQGDAKFQKGKIFTENRDRLIVTAAGDAEFIKVGYDKLSDKLKFNLPKDAAAARALVEVATSKLYKDTQFIVAIRCANDKITLIKTASQGDGAMLEDHYVAVGSGSAIFEYWAQYFLFAQPMTLDIASLLVMFMLRETKGAGIYCGGDTQIFKMPRQAGALSRTRSLYDDREILAGFPQTPIKVLLDAMDLSRPDTEYEERIEEFRKQIGAFRAALKMKQHFKRGVYTDTSNIIMDFPRNKEEGEI